MEDDILLALYVLVENGGIGRRWMFDNANDALADKQSHIKILLEERIKNYEDNYRDYDYESHEVMEYKRLLQELN